MSKIKFTKKQIELLQKNKYVKHISENGITYTNEFKEYFMNQKLNGIIAVDIFNDVGLPESILGRKRIKSANERFTKYFSRDEGFNDTRKGKSGRTLTKKLSLEEQLKKAQEELMYLKVENEFLKKINRVERQAKKKHQ